MPPADKKETRRHASMLLLPSAVSILRVTEPGPWFFLVCPSDIDTFPAGMRFERHSLVLSRIYRFPGESLMAVPGEGDIEVLPGAQELRARTGNSPVIAWSRSAVVKDVVEPLARYGAPPVMWRNFSFLSEHPVSLGCGMSDDTFYQAANRCLGLDAIASVFPSAHGFSWCMTEIAGLLAAPEPRSGRGGYPEGGGAW